MGGSGKQEKQWLPLPSLLSCESLVSVKENINKKRKRKRKKERKEKNTDETQTKLNAPQIRYYVKILPQ